jgi:hypothetical protein
MKLESGWTNRIIRPSIESKAKGPVFLLKQSGKDVVSLSRLEIVSERICKNNSEKPWQMQIE